MIDPEFVTRENVKEFEQKYGLVTLPARKCNNYFVERGLMRYAIGLNSTQVEHLFNGTSTVAVVSGFGVTGMCHLGTRLIVDELCALATKGVKVDLFLSTTDGIAKGLSAERIAEVRGTILEFLATLLRNRNVSLFEKDIQTRNSFHDAIRKNVSDKELREIYGQRVSEKQRLAIIDMVASVLSNREDFVLLLGIDELLHAVFIRYVAERLQRSVPGVIFNEIVLGYDRRKMGKSRPEYSLVVTNTAAEEIAKSCRFLTACDGDPECIAECALRFSKFGRIGLGSCREKHAAMREVILQECRQQ